MIALGITMQPLKKNETGKYIAMLKVCNFYFNETLVGVIYRERCLINGVNR